MHLMFNIGFTDYKIYVLIEVQMKIWLNPISFNLFLDIVTFWASLERFTVSLCEQQCNTPPFCYLPFKTWFE